MHNPRMERHLASPSRSHDTERDDRLALIPWQPVFRPSPRVHALTYDNTQTRAAHYSMQLYTCIVNSLTKTDHTSVALLKPEYTVGAINSIVSGTRSLLKVVIRKSQVDTAAECDNKPHN